VNIAEVVIENDELAKKIARHTEKLQQLDAVSCTLLSMKKSDQMIEPGPKE
jgi:hypothetical protein